MSKTQIEKMSKALEWYGEQAEALFRYTTSSPTQVDGIAAVVQALALDGGARATVRKSMEGEMYSYSIRKLPACRDWQGKVYLERYGVTKTDNLGLCWDSGEFATYQEASAYIESMLK